jgi:hypothetical protein
MILDYKLFTPYSKNLQANLLTIVEELPGFYVQGDVTNYLSHENNQQGFWPSYNVPFFPAIYKMTGELIFFLLFTFVSLLHDI